MHTRRVTCGVCGIYLSKPYNCRVSVALFEFFILIHFIAYYISLAVVNVGLRKPALKRLVTNKTCLVLNINEYVIEIPASVYNFH